jgi:phage terminase small subunit
MPRPRKPGLTDKQERFCLEFVVDLNATAAARRAGYSARTANRTASDLLSKPDIAQRINELQGEKRQRLELTADAVVLEVARLAFYDPADFFDAQGRLLPLTEMPAHARRAIAGIEVLKKNVTAGDGKTDDVHKIRLAPKGPVLELAAKLLGMVVDRKEQGKPGDFARWTDDQLQARMDELAAKARGERPAARGVH